MPRMLETSSRRLLTYCARLKRTRMPFRAIEIDGDLGEYIERIRAAGVKITREPKKSPGGTRAIAFIEDPNGIPVELLEPRLLGIDCGEKPFNRSPQSSKSNALTTRPLSIERGPRPLALIS